MKFSVQFFSSLIVGLVVFLSLLTPALAQTYSSQTNPYTNFNTNPDVPQNFHSFTQVATTEVLAAVLCQLAGVDPTRQDRKCLGYDAQTGSIGFVDNSGGMLGLTTRGIAFTFQLPVHTGQYTKYLANNFGLYDKTYAATGTQGAVKNGVGFTGLEPLLSIWLAFRNLVYLLFIIIFIIVGVAIMLRVQIDPRTVMTIENMLPKIVIGLILITFSFAIAGVLVDMMWVLTFFVVNTLQQVDTNTAGAAQIAQQGTKNLLVHPILYLNFIWSGGIWGLVGGVNSGISDFINGAFTAPWSNNSTQITNGTLSSCSFNVLNWDWGCFWSTFMTTILNAIFQTIAFLLGWLVIVIAILIAMIRLWISLIKAYILIILDVILGPFYIAAGLIPGSQYGFGGWMRGICANLMTFPTVVFLLLLARVLNDNFNTAQRLFVPPLIGNPNGDGNPIGAFMAFGIILITPEILNTLRTRVFQAPESGLTQAAMGGAATGPRLLRGLTSTGVSSFYNQTTGKWGGFSFGRFLGHTTR